jgi:hypothetical protein
MPMFSRALAARTTPLFLGVALAVALVGAAPGCGDAAQPAHTGSSAGLPRWDARAKMLFDDNIDPAAVGLSMEGPSPRSDTFLRERSQTADVVARVRVQTVTVDSVGDQSTYHLGVQVGVPTLAPAKVPDRSLELSIKAQSGAFGIAKAFDSRLRGQTFVGFVRRFATEDGDVELHWHLSADTAEVVSAVKEAVALQEISGS